VLDDADGPSSLVASMLAVAEQLESWIDATTANGVRWGSRSALVATVSHFPELDIELEVLRSRRSTRLTEDEVELSGPGCTRPRTRLHRTFLL
jgi:hypothetical protein